MPETLVLTGSRLCGFCADGNHKRCPHAIENGFEKAPKSRPRLWLCPCAEPGCGGKILSCVRCKRVHDDVVPTERVCVDRGACDARIDKGRMNNPIYQQVHEIQEKHRMAKEENKPVREPAKPKTGTCKCGCEGTTKGGDFLPGHDARLVSTTVKSVLDKKVTEAGARKIMAPFSDALKAKFEKSLTLQREKAEKSAAAAKAKEDAKAEKAKADKAAKAEKAAAAKA